MNCWSVPGKVKSFSISLQDWLKSLEKWSEVQDFKRPQRWTVDYWKKQVTCVSQQGRLQPFPSCTESHQGAAALWWDCVPSTWSACHSNQWKVRVCMFHSHQAITEMGKALSLHLKAFHQKPIRLSIPAGKRPNVSERRECCDRILN